jgi:hypothetical protein
MFGREVRASLSQAADDVKVTKAPPGVGLPHTLDFESEGSGSFGARHCAAARYTAGARDRRDTAGVDARHREERTCDESRADLA